MNDPELNEAIFVAVQRRRNDAIEFDFDPEVPGGMIVIDITDAPEEDSIRKASEILSSGLASAHKKQIPMFENGVRKKRYWRGLVFGTSRELYIEIPEPTDPEDSRSLLIAVRYLLKHSEKLTGAID